MNSRVSDFALLLSKAYVNVMTSSRTDPDALVACVFGIDYYWEVTPTWEDLATIVLANVPNADTRFDKHELTAAMAMAIDALPQQ